MTADAIAEQIVVDEALEWRCGGCAVRPMLARFGLVGGVHIHVSGRRHYALNYLVDVRQGSIRAHCPACHSWRELYWDDGRQTMAEREWAGYVPVIGCSCEFERFAHELARRRGEEHGTATETGKAP